MYNMHNKVRPIRFVYNIREAMLYFEESQPYKVHHSQNGYTYSLTHKMNKHQADVVCFNRGGYLASIIFNSTMENIT